MRGDAGYANIPQELKERRQWVCWRLEKNEEGEPIKVPRQPNGGARAKSNVPGTWDTFEAAVEVAVKPSSRYAGIGFILSRNDHYTAIDLDHCISDDGTIEPWAQAIVRRLDSYTEYSISGKGLHIFVKAGKPGPRCRVHTAPNLEMYSHSRFIVVTGNRVPNTPPDIRPAANEIVELYNETFGGPEPEPEPTVLRRIERTEAADLSDWELIEKAKRSKNGQQFSDLWNGNADAYSNDMSAASLALCNYLAFWTNDDTERIDRLFRESGLMRSKWDERRPEGTWGLKTILKAISDPHETYSGRSSTRRKLEAAATPAPVVPVSAPAPVPVQVCYLDSEDEAGRPTPRDSIPSAVLSLDALVPPGTYLDNYVQYASELTDAPKEFHLASALSILSAAVGNRVYLEVWGQRLYPNLWIVLLAPTGFYRKSTAISIGLKTLREKCGDAVLPDDFTREKLVECLAEQPSGLIPVYEFGELLARLGRDYNLGTKEFLANIFDGNIYKRATKRETAQITAPAVSILGASTIDWIHDRVTEGDVRGGFLARFLFWPSVNKHGWKGIAPAGDNVALWELQDYLGSIQSQIAGPVVLPELVVERFDAWVHKHEDEVNERKLAPEVQGFYIRLATYALKLAVLYQLAIDSSLVLTTDALDYAIRLVEHLKVGIVRLITEDMTTTRDAKDLKRVQDIIEREPGISRTRILWRCHMLTKRLDELLLTLIEGGVVVAQSVSTSTKPKQVFYLVGTEEKSAGSPKP